MSATPPESRPASPTTRYPRRQLEDETRKPDKNYRRYATGIERALSSFDPAKVDWPDYISFLGRLLKAVQNHPPVVDTLPHKASVANRLSQCLRPSLPSGVHQKALEVYSYIFTLIGQHSLSLDLPVYLPGLSSVLAFASLSLRPSFLSLIETHIVPLKATQLRPALRSLILALLPGLEEETAEEFERTLNLLDKVKDAVNTHTHGTATFRASGDEHFWQCFFLACIGSPTRRHGALAYLVNRLPKLAGSRSHDGTSITPLGEHVDLDDRLSPAAEATVSPEPGLLIRCLVSGLEDDQLLTQRGFLDLLLSHLPLNSPVLTERVNKNDLCRLVEAATTVVARRDMSLNRRLWSWFLGPEAGSTDEQEELSSPVERKSSKSHLETSSDYFQKYGLESLVNSVSTMLAQNLSQPQQRSRPFRICLSLMDRIEVGSQIIPRVFMLAITNVYDYQAEASKQDFQEVLRSASSFFDGVEGGIIWGQIADLSMRALASEENAEAKYHIDRALFILQHFNVREEDMLAVHIPLVCLLLLEKLNELSSNDDSTPSNITPSATQPSYPLIEALVNHLPQKTLGVGMSGSGAPAPTPNSSMTQDGAVDSLWSYYGRGAGAPSNATVPLAARQVALYLLRSSTSLLLRSLEDYKQLDTFVARSSIFTGLISRLIVPEDYNFQGIIGAVDSLLAPSSHDATSVPIGGTLLPFPILHATASVIVSIVSVQRNAAWQRSEMFLSLVNRLVHRLWDHLSPTHPRYHLEAVGCIWQVEDLLDADNSVEASITSLFAQQQLAVAGGAALLEHARRFAILWTHTNSGQNQHAKRPSTFRSRTSFVTAPRVRPSSSIDIQEKLYRPLFFLLDLGEQDPELEDFLRTWLDRLPNAAHVFQVLVWRSRKSLITVSPALANASDPTKVARTAHKDKRRDGLYYLQRLLRLLRTTSGHLWAALREDAGEHRQPDADEQHETILELLADTAFDVVQGYVSDSDVPGAVIDQSLQLTSLSLLQTCFASPAAAGLQSLSLDTRLIGLLRQHLHHQVFDSSIQGSLLETTLAALRTRTVRPAETDKRKSHRRLSSVDTINSLTTPQRTHNTAANMEPKPLDVRVASDLTKCLQEGLGSSSSIFVLENWVHFLVEVLPLLHATLFQSIIPLVETLCERIRHEFQNFNSSFIDNIPHTRQTSPESGLAALLNGLQHLLVIAHDKLSLEESRRTQSRTPEPPQGFFGNVVSGVFTGEVQKPQATTGNTRLTVVLCFQDALRICLSIWSWGAYGGMYDGPDPTCLASFAYVSQRLRNQTRRMLDRMFMVEGLECLETLIVAWAHQGAVSDQQAASPSISLLHVLDSSTPKQTMPALFNAIYSRTSPGSLDPSRQSTKTSDITDAELAQFLLDYTRSLDDDAMDEIWGDCMTFLRDVLIKPAPQTRVLPHLLHFLVILAEKVEKTNFGEQRKMRKDLGDLFLRLLTATLAIRPPAIQHDPDASSTESLLNPERRNKQPAKRQSRQTDMLEVLVALAPRLPVVLTEADKLINAVSAISINVMAPLLHVKIFPDNLRSAHLTLLLRLTAIPTAIKIWRKDLIDLLMHPRLFSIDVSQVSHLAPLANRLAIHDTDRLSDLCVRINPPTSAGIMFGVGANAARTEADRKTQVNLRRMAFIILSAEPDTAVSSLPTIDEKISELLTATAASSPSSSTRAEVFMLLRSLVLSTSAIHLASLWPTITSELQRAIASAVPQSADFEAYNIPSLLQACKLLDLLVFIAPDDFQMNEWLFITDSIEAVYKPSHWEPVALVDDIAEELGSSLNIDMAATPSTEKQAELGLELTPSAQVREDASPFRKPLLVMKDHEAVTGMSKVDFVAKVLQPFFSRLSIHAYEGIYSMKPADVEGCKHALTQDLFDEHTIVG